MKNARTSTVKGVIANTEKQTFEPFEIVTEYTRSNAKAIKFVKAAMKLDDNALVSISEIINEPAKRVVYDVAAIVKNQVKSYNEREAAEKAAKDSQTVITYNTYVYTGAVWIIDKQNLYTTVNVNDESHVKFGKIDARAFVKMRAEKESGGHALAVDNVLRTQITRYAVIENDKLQDCVKSED